MALPWGIWDAEWAGECEGVCGRGDEGGQGLEGRQGEREMPLAVTESGVAVTREMTGPWDGDEGEMEDARGDEGGQGLVGRRGEPGMLMAVTGSGVAVTREMTGPWDGDEGGMEETRGGDAGVEGDEKGGLPERKERRVCTLPRRRQPPTQQSTRGDAVTLTICRSGMALA